MGANRKTPTSQPSRDYRVATEASHNPQLEQLREEFAKFRSANQLRTRIPESLRLATLAALQKGTTESEVRNACGITAEQIEQWRKGQKMGKPKHNSARPQPRVYPVIDETPSPALYP